MEEKGLTVKELKEFINSISSEYDDLKVLVTDPNWGEYCMGSSETTIKEIWGTEFSTYPGYYLSIELN